MAIGLIWTAAVCITACVLIVLFTTLTPLLMGWNVWSGIPFAWIYLAQWLSLLTVLLLGTAVITGVIGGVLLLADRMR